MVRATPSVEDLENPRNLILDFKGTYLIGLMGWCDGANNN